MNNETIAITGKASSQTTEQAWAGVVTLDAPSTVTLPVGPEEIAAFSQSGMDLVVTLQNGEQIVLADFFVQVDGMRSELVLEDANGVLWLGQYQTPWQEFAFAEVNEEAMAAGGGGIPPWVFP
ncbi:BapA prefix-like domain-containing protein, partial [Halomonas sp. 707D4]